MSLTPEEIAQIQLKAEAEWDAMFDPTPEQQKVQEIEKLEDKAAHGELSSNEARRLSKLYAD